MREIKFRGKSAGTGDWVFGDLTGPMFCQGAVGLARDDMCLIWGRLEGYIPVAKSSVGQYTGMKDKNGVEIFEGDIVRFYDDIEDEFVTGVVKYEKAAFVIENSQYDDLYFMEGWTYEVAGNIHTERKEMEKMKTENFLQAERLLRIRKEIDRVHDEYYHDPFNDVHLKRMVDECRKAIVVGYKEAIRDVKMRKKRKRDGNQFAYRKGASEALAGQWRSVEDELPEADYEVLVVYSHSYSPDRVERAIAYYDGEDWYTQEGSLVRPTHWMTIPEPFKDESE